MNEIGESQCNSDNSKMKLSSFKAKKPIRSHVRGKSSGSGVDNVPTPPESTGEEDSIEMLAPSGTEDWKISKVTMI